MAGGNFIRTPLRCLASWVKRLHTTATRSGGEPGTPHSPLHPPWLCLRDAGRGFTLLHTTQHPPTLRSFSFHISRPHSGPNALRFARIRTDSSKACLAVLPCCHARAQREREREDPVLTSWRGSCSGALQKNPSQRAWPRLRCLWPRTGQATHTPWVQTKQR